MKLTQRGETIVMTSGERPFAVYHHGRDLPKPYLADIHAPGGAIVSRPIPGQTNHPYHRGVWVAVDEVNGVRFWAEMGRIENRGVRLLVPDGPQVRFEVVNHWLAADGRTAVVETTVVGAGDDHLLTYDIAFAPAERPVTFGDTKEGLFGIRLADQLCEKQTGRVVTSSGVHGSQEAWGRTFDWVDDSGTLDGRACGAALFDWPANFRPSRYHVRDYGLMTINPFGEHAYTGGREPARPVTLQPGQSLRLRYGLYIHDGDATEARVAEVHRRWLRSTNESPAVER